ncbi:hypothetical protein [Brachyspira sp.]|uniref:hypothetical protein n=1 Tax=Brachyspira sp. TaxID=1977261 RepID=UPI003D7EE672
MKVNQRVIASRLVGVAIKIKWITSAINSLVMTKKCIVIANGSEAIQNNKIPFRWITSGVALVMTANISK